MDYTLAMTFINTNGDKLSLSVSDVKPDISSAEVGALMDTIVAKDIFLSKGCSIAAKYDAQITQRQTTKFDIK
ncbi:DUF2922 domain-containing protein [Clostridium fungisolvens]|uniref:DUF2922 domain-containing protein n=1 Tax=Clostridium fungisolvens TaxID=1604897 RepID=A0A6V8SMK8_9CLOT|nr:DUF2922 domain-containing protein [Clostridium fungisolvens]GFP76408.1 hypothetical protein bsdtw1_02510 [Clostridium fungisolvens]